MIRFFILFVLCSVCAGQGAAAQISGRVVRYEDFGAKGDGQTDDLAAIAAAHAYANENGLPVRANDEATYYIGGGDQTADIRTDVEFGKAQFIIDDRSVENRSAPVFRVVSAQESIPLAGVKSLKRSQERLDITLPERCLVIVQNSKVRNYIRLGKNQNEGNTITDVFLVDTDGRVAESTPILWDFEEVTEIKAIPIDAKKLTIHGGRFTTIANQAESKYTYYSRGFMIHRSNVEIDGLEHFVKGEGDQGAPYRGFISISDCAAVTVRDSVLTGHRTYHTIGRAGLPVSMGTYDLHLTRAVAVSIVNCRQSNDIMDGRCWGIMASNYCKNLLYDGCTLSRFDAHMGVCNATVRNSTLGHAGLNAIGHGVLTVEDSTIRSRRLVNMRPDYGSTWRGEFVIRNTVFSPGGNNLKSIHLITGQNLGQHDFGYTCYMPQRITIDGLRIEDENHASGYQGPVLFSDFNPKWGTPGFTEKYPLVKTKELIVKNVTVASGKPLRVSENPEMVQAVRVTD